MKKKVLLLTLGTGDTSYRELDPDTVLKLPGNKTILQTYKDTEYLFNGKVVHSSMLAQPIMQELKPDIVFFIGTVRSTWTSLYSNFVSDEKRNEEFIRELLISEKNHGKDTKEEELEKLQRRIQGIFEESEVFMAEGIEKAEILLIKYGLTEDELEYNYHKLSRIGEFMKESDAEYEVSFDITHSFRSLPIYNLTILNYLKALSSASIRITHVYYGNLDVSYENNHVAPILDFSDMVRLMDLTAAVAEFRDTGNVKALFPYVPESDRRIKQELELFDWAIQTNDLNRLEKSIQGLQECLDVQASSRYGDLYSMLRDTLNRS